MTTQENPDGLLPTDPPHKRLRLELTLEAHDLDHLLRELEIIVNDAHREGLPAGRVSGGGYYFTLSDLGEGRSREDYERELSEWCARPRAHLENTASLDQ